MLGLLREHEIKKNVKKQRWKGGEESKEDEDGEDKKPYPLQQVER